jgi:hypothetical protein
MIPSSIYQIDFIKLVQRVLPTKLRTAERLAWLKCLTYPASYLYQQFLYFKTAKDYQLLITPQVCYLKLLLNNRYDNTLRRIVIVDGNDKPPVYLYQEAELKPVFLYQESEAQPVFFYTEGEMGTLTDDFVVEVPSSIVFEEAEMRSLLKSFKLAGTKFSIKYV